MEEMNRPAEKQNDDLLFQTLTKNKKRRRRRIWLTAGGITLAILLLIGLAVRTLRARVDAKFKEANNDVLSYTAAAGSISTTVTGKGILEDLEPEELSVPNGVKVDEIVVSVNDSVKKGDIIAELDMSSVLSAMSQAQTELESFDQQLSDASEDAVGTAVKAGVSGRVMQIYCEDGDSVPDCMYKNGALLLLSTDGYLTGQIPAGDLKAGDSITVRRNDGSELPCFVDGISDGNAILLMDDKDLADGEQVTVVNENGNTLGTCSVQIRSPLRVTGFAGTVKSVNVSVGDSVRASTEVITLTDTEYSANYAAILRQREEKEEELQKLIQLDHDGALLSPIDGTVCSVEELNEKTVDYLQAAQESTEQKIASVSSDREMSVTVNVDETDILSLQEGQSVELTVASISDEPFEGAVTELDKKAQSSAGVTNYRAKIVLKKQPGMLPGMSAKAVIRIQGVDNAIIIPVDALHQTSASAYVYTSYDPEAGEYGGKVEVTTGISNANEVEITSGLKVGDVVYYTERQKSDFWGFGGFNAGPGSWDASQDFGDYDFENYPDYPPQGFGGMG